MKVIGWLASSASVPATTCDRSSCTGGSTLNMHAVSSGASSGVVVGAPSAATAAGNTEHITAVVIGVAAAVRAMPPGLSTATVMVACANASPSSRWNPGGTGAAPPDTAAMRKRTG